MQQSSYVGIDVFKHHLDVAFLGGPKVWRTPNDASGIAALIRRAVAQEKQREPIPSQPLVTGSVEQHLPFLELIPFSMHRIRQRRSSWRTLRA